MSNRRMVDPSFWQSESVARLPLSARYLFIGIFSNADDQGRMKANPSLIRAKVYPLDDIGLDAIAKDLDLLEDGEFISRYEVDGLRYVQVVNWWKYQRPTWAWPSELPAPEGWVDRACYRKGNLVVKSNWHGGDQTAEGEPASNGPTAAPPRPHRGPTTTPLRPHNEVTVTLPPRGSNSTSRAIALAPATAPAIAAPETQILAAAVADLSGLLSESTIRAKLSTWPHPEHARELRRRAEQNPKIKSKAGFVLSELQKGWMPPADIYLSADPPEPGDESPPDPDIGPAGTSGTSDAVPFWPGAMLGRMDPSTFNQHFRDSMARFVDGKIVISLRPGSVQIVEKRLRPIIEQVLADHGKVIVMEAV